MKSLRLALAAIYVAAVGQFGHGRTEGHADKYPSAAGQQSASGRVERPAVQTRPAATAAINAAATAAIDAAIAAGPAAIAAGARRPPAS